MSTVLLPDCKLIKAGAPPLQCGGGNKLCV